MDTAAVRALTVQIQALKEEKAGYKREISRLDEDIKAHELLRDKAIMDRGDQTSLDLVARSEE